jgi:hypothetical protein
MRRGVLTISLALVLVLLAAPVAVLAHPHNGEPILFGIAAAQPFAVHPRLFRTYVTKIQRALLKLNWTLEGKDILASIQYKEIVVSNDFDYDVHREVAQRLKIPH